MTIILKNPDAPASAAQLYKLHELTHQDTRNWKLTMKEASDKINELNDTQQTVLTREEIEQEIENTPFNEAHVSIVTGDQRSGKTTVAVGKIRDAYAKDCGKIYCEQVLGLQCEVKAFYDVDRVLKIKHNGQTKYLQVPSNYKLHSPLRIFSNIHLYGMPYVYIPSFPVMLEWLRGGFISNGWLLADEAHRGMSARNGMSQMGKDFVGEYFQFGKSHLDVMLLTHFPKMIDYLARLIPTTYIHCRYDPKTFKVYYTMRKKGVSGEEEHSFYAPQYFKYFNSDEKVNG